MDRLRFHTELSHYVVKAIIPFQPLIIIVTVLMTTPFMRTELQKFGNQQFLGMRIASTNGQPALISTGGAAVGAIAVGGLAVGILAFGGGAVGVVAFGGGAVGIIAVGGGAIGVVALGGGAIGWVAIGGGAVGCYAVCGSGVGRYLCAHEGGRGTYCLTPQRQDLEAVLLFCRWMPRLADALEDYDFDAASRASPAAT